MEIKFKARNMFYFDIFQQNVFRIDQINYIGKMCKGEHKCTNKSKNMVVNFDENTETSKQ